MDTDIPRLRRSLEKARKEDLFGLIDVAVGQAVVTGVEMLTRARLALQAACLYYDTRRSPAGQEFPNVRDEVERVERITRFLTDVACDYAKVSHLSHLAKRRNGDPKVVDFQAAVKEAGQKRTSRKAATTGGES